MLITSVTCLMKTQLRLEAFYTFNERFAKIRSKRINKAVKGIAGNQTSDLMDDPLQEVSKSRKKRRVSPVDNNSEKPSKKLDENDVRNQSNYMDKSTPKHSRKRRNAGEPVPSVEKSTEPPMEAQGRRSHNRASRGTGRSRGRGRGRGIGRGRGKSSGFEPCESTSGDSDDDEQEVLAKKLEGPDEMRRVSYNLFSSLLIIQGRIIIMELCGTKPSFDYTLWFTIQFRLISEICM
jgi:DNA excision repair protein ERCC-5